MREFEGKNIVIVGASSGLGEALTNQFVEEDANVYALARTIDTKSFYPSVTKIPCDVTNPESVSYAFNEIGDKAHALDVVISTVGQGLVKSFAEMTDEEMKSLVDVNLLGSMYVGREAYKRMIPHQKGHIVFVSSTTGLEGKPNEVVYSAVKQGLRGMNQALSKEAAMHNVEATCIFPGGMRSENFWKQAKPENNISDYMDPKDVSTKIVDMLRQEPPHPIEYIIRRQS